MPHITTNYKMFVPAGHHRQPRNANATIDLLLPSGGDTPYTPAYAPQLPIPGSNPQQYAKLLFWSDTDGSNGIIRPPLPFDIPSAASARTVTGWYFPDGGSGPPGPTVIIDDAFSARAGAFIDDTFVDVTSDPSLTGDANVIGVVPTKSAQTLVAKGNVMSTTEPFSQWLLNDAIMPIGQATLHVPAATQGIAIAIYQQGELPRGPRVNDYFAEVVRIFFGVINDGPGLTDHGPIGPWGPLIQKLAAGGAIAAQAERLHSRIGAEIGHLAAQEAIADLKKAIAAFEKIAGKNG